MDRQLFRTYQSWSHMYLIWGFHVDLRGCFLRTKVVHSLHRYLLFEFDRVPTLDSMIYPFSSVNVRLSLKGFRWKKLDAWTSELGLDDLKVPIEYHPLWLIDYLFILNVSQFSYPCSVLALIKDMSWCTLLRFKFHFLSSHHFYVGSTNALLFPAYCPDLGEPHS